VKKKVKKLSKTKNENPKPPLDKVEEKEVTPFDFGGLPQRDLKKNLGCG
jgi:hypothetical protein